MGKKSKKSKKEKSEVSKCDDVEENSNERAEVLNESEQEVVESAKEIDKNTMKRSHNSNDSDSESEKHSKAKKKKKKQPMVSDSTEKKGKKSIRQMKREKHAQRKAETEAAAKDHLKSQCISYLSQWKHDRQNWKFMKAKQVWLYKNKFNNLLIPDSSWQVFLEYFESAQGNIKTMLLDDANKVIKQMDEWTEKQKTTENEDADNADDGDTSKPSDLVYNRARSLIQCLQE